MTTNGTEERPLPGSWIETSIETLTNHVTSGSRGWAKHYSDDGALFIRVGNFNRLTNRIDLNNVVFVNAPTGAESERTRLKLNDVLVTITADVGMVGFVDERVFRWGEAYINQHVGLLRLNDTRLAPYISFLIASEIVQKQFRAKQYGLTKSGLNLTDLRSLKIPIPPLTEQRLIVAEIEKQFTRLDQAVASLRRLQSNLARYKASVLKAACEGRLVPQDPADEPAADLLARILAERRAQWQAANPGKKYQEPVGVEENTAVLPDLPDGWVWTTTEVLATNESNAICAGPFGTIFKAKDFRPIGVPIIFLRHVQPGQYAPYRKPGFMDSQKWEELFQGYSVYGGELLVTKLGEPPGVCAIYPEGIGPAMVTPDVMKMTVNGCDKKLCIENKYRKIEG